MKKKDFFGKHNGDYFKSFKDGGYARLYHCDGIYIIKIHRNGHDIKRRTFGIDGFCWTWRIFSEYMKKTRKPYEFPEV